MGFIEDMRWWHWIVISLIIGAALGYINIHNVAELPDPVSDYEFERDLMRPPLQDHGRIEPWIMNIKLFPPLTVNGITSQMVYFMWRNPKSLGKPGGDAYVPHSTVATLPFSPRGSKELDHLSGQKWPGTQIYVAKQGDTWRSILLSHYGSANTTYLDLFVYANLSYVPPTGRTMAEAHNPRIFPGYNYYLPWSPASNHTLGDFLDVAAKDISANPNYKTATNWAVYRYQWWHDPRYAYWFFMSASFLGVGVLWPIIMRFLVTGGLGRKPREDYDLSRFKGGEDSKSAGAAAVTDEDRQQLQELEATLEASVKASGTTLTSGKIEEQPAAPVKELKAGTLEAPQTAPPPPDEKKDYKGEYYPVARPGGKTEGKKD